MKSCDNYNETRMYKMKTGIDKLSWYKSFFSKIFLHNFPLNLFSKFFCTNIGVKVYVLKILYARISTISIYIGAKDLAIISRFPPYNILPPPASKSVKCVVSE
jgi:hypothetical protein